MNKNIEKIDGYLKGAALPEHVSDQHRRQLRRQILNRIERRQTMSIKVRSWKYAAVIALICTGVVAAAVVGVKIHKYHFTDKHPKYGYMLRSEDGKTVTNIPDSWADNPEHAVQVKEELDLLKQQDNRKLVGVSEIEVNGQLDSRWLSYEHNLSDGQTIEVSERDPDDNGQNTVIGDRERREELNQLWDEQLRQGGNGGATTEERQVKGCVISFRKWRLVFSDGTEVVYSIGQLKDD
jgi:hypothetical protein